MEIDSLYVLNDSIKFVLVNDKLVVESIVQNSKNNELLKTFLPVIITFIGVFIGFYLNNLNEKY